MEEENKEEVLEFVLHNDETIINTFFENGKMFALTNKGNIIKSEHAIGDWVNITPKRKGACPKCGSIQVNRYTVKYGDLINSSSYSKVDNEFVRSSEYDYFFKLTAKKEHVDCTCKQCNNKYRENI